METKVFKLAEETVELLKQKKLKIATAESCTGGMLSQYITSVSGASEVFELGICSYNCDKKHKILGVRNKVLKRFGAVSDRAASEMAENVRKKAGADIGVSITGSAGPSLCEGHPMGYVYISLAVKDKTMVKLLEIEPKSREYVRLMAVYELFCVINDYLKG